LKILINSKYIGDILGEGMHQKLENWEGGAMEKNPFYRVRHTILQSACRYLEWVYETLQ
jgi:hypothetical protein